MYGPHCGAPNSSGHVSWLAESSQSIYLAKHCHFRSCLREPHVDTSFGHTQDRLAPALLLPSGVDSGPLKHQHPCRHIISLFFQLVPNLAGFSKGIFSNVAARVHSGGEESLKQGVEVERERERMSLERLLSVTLDLRSTPAPGHCCLHSVMVTGRGSSRLAAPD